MALNLDILDLEEEEEEAKKEQENSTEVSQIAESWAEIEEKKKVKGKEETETKEKATEEAKQVEPQQKTVSKKSEKKDQLSSLSTAPNTEDPAKQEGEHLRSPICVIMGHVDTGKTKLLDKIRKTNVQLGEAGGITQQIGATYFPQDTLRNLTKYFAEKYHLQYQLPGLLIIDTPGHESFTNLRSRGSSLCDIAILVVDIMHGIEPQTIESINLLQAKHTPFIIALNKIDRIDDWKASTQPYSPLDKTFPGQNKHCKEHFKKRLDQVVVEFAERGINVKLYTQMKFGENVKITEIPIVPTSAKTGEGIPDLLMLVQLLTQTKMKKKLTSKDQLECSVLEDKVEEGIGTTLDVVLVNGVLHVGDVIVLAGQKDGVSTPIVTKIRALLTPQPLKELRVRGDWVKHDIIYAAMGCKIAASDLEGAIAGSELFVAHNADEEEMFKEKVLQDTESILQQVDKSEIGLMIQSSTLGSLEALLSYLKSKDYKVAQIAIGPVHRKDVMAIAPMVEKAPTYAVILAFDVPVTPEAKIAAQEYGITIFEAKIIYHLTDQYEIFMKEYKRKAKEAARKKAIFPSIIQINPGCIIRRDNPMIVGIKVLRGTLRRGTPLCTQVGDRIRGIGFVDGLKVNDKDAEKASPADLDVSISIKPPSDWTPCAGKDVKEDVEIYSRITREHIDILKEHFRDEMSREDWQLIRDLKLVFKIP